MKSLSIELIEKLAKQKTEWLESFKQDYAQKNKHRKYKVKKKEKKRISHQLYFRNL